MEKENKAITYFLNLLGEANLPGPDFYEFYTALNDNKAALGNTVTDEKMIYSMVYNTLKGMGLKKEILESSIDSTATASI